METIMAAVISAASALLVCIINSNNQNRKILLEMDKHDELQAFRIEQLEKKVDKHNNVIERTFKLEEEQRVQEEQIKVVNHRISDLEEYHK